MCHILIYERVYISVTKWERGELYLNTLTSNISVLLDAGDESEKGSKEMVHLLKGKFSIWKANKKHELPKVEE